MYEPFQVLSSIDDHKWAIIALCSVAMVFNYTWFFAAWRLARRDRVYSIPLFCSLFWFAGDASFVWRYDEWFNTYDHWYTKLFWVALVFTVMFEIAFLAQAIKYGREELLPSWSQRQFAALMVAGAAAAVVVWSFVSHVIDDPLYIAYFYMANVAMPLFAPGLLMRRRSRAGQSTLVWACYLGMLTCWYLATVLWFGPEFRSVEYISIWVLNTAACLGMLIAVSRMPAYEPASTSPNRTSGTVGGPTVGVGRGRQLV